MTVVRFPRPMRPTEPGTSRQAITFFHKAAEEGETPPCATINMANAYFQLDSLAESVVYYRACVRNAPDFIKANLNLAVCYYQLNDFGRCLASIKRTLELDPANQKALLIQAATLRRVGAIAKAVVAFENIIGSIRRLKTPISRWGKCIVKLAMRMKRSYGWNQFPPGGKNKVYVYHASCRPV